MPAIKPTPRPSLLTRIVNRGCSLHPRLAEWRIRSALARNIPRALRAANIPGLQFACTLGGRPTFLYSHGIAAGLAPMTDCTPLCMASLSKPVAALVTLRCVHKGLLSLDQPLAPILDDLTQLCGFPAAAMNSLTPRRLLCHASGLEGKNPPFLPHSITHAPLERVIAGEFGPAGIPTVSTSPDGSNLYAGTNYLLLELALSRICRMPFAVISQQMVFDPLGLSRTSFNRSARTAPGIAAEHDRDGRVLEHHWPPAAACSGIVSTSAELIVIMRCILDDARGAGRLLPQHLAMLLVIPQPDADGTFTLGLHRVSTGHFLNHHGHRPGLRATVLVEPESESAAMVATNGERGEEVTNPIIGMVKECARLLIPRR